MTLEIDKLLDVTGWKLLSELQKDARLSYSELGKRVGLSSPAVAERMRKMEDSGIIEGYHVEVKLEKLGLPVLAIIYLESIGGHSCNRAFVGVSKIPEVIECYRLTGMDSVIIKAVATSLDHLARVIDAISVYGIPTTSILRSESMKRNSIPYEITRLDTNSTDGSL